MKIKTTDRHAKLLQTPPEGRYLLEIVKVQEAKSKSNPNNTNCVIDFQIAEGDWEGCSPKTFYTSLNSEFGIAMLLSIQQAITGDDTGAQEFDPVEDWKGALVLADCVHELYNGNKQLAASSFYNKDKVAASNPF